MSPTARSKEVLQAAIVRWDPRWRQIQLLGVHTEQGPRPGLALEDARQVMGAREAMTGENYERP